MPRKEAGKCIFCGKGNLSKEHFWPEWTSSLLPSYPANQHVERLQIITRVTKLKGPPLVRTKPGNAWTKKIRVVCKACNNGWMSVLETAVRPILTPLICTTPHTIDAAPSLVLARWVALKIMVGEHNQRGDAVTSPEERRVFQESLEIPKNFRIWIAKCGVGGWETAYFRHSGTVSLTPDIRPEHRSKNIHSVTFGIGDLLVHVLHTTVSGLDLDLNLSQPHVVVPLFPYSELIDWPTARNLTVNEAAFLAHTLDRLFRTHMVRWQPFLA